MNWLYVFLVGAVVYAASFFLPLAPAGARPAAQWIGGLLMFVGLLLLVLSVLGVAVPR